MQRYCTFKKEPPDFCSESTVTSCSACFSHVVIPHFFCLLSIRECLSDGSICVSSEGLESSDFSSSASIDEQRSLIPGIIISKTKSVQWYSCFRLLPFMQKPHDLSPFFCVWTLQLFDCSCAVCLFIFAVKARSDSDPAASSLKCFVPPSLVTPQRLEEDILFQWRLRRKMEQAREGSRHVQPSLHGPTLSWQTETLNQPAADGAFLKVRLVCATSTILL